MSILPLPVFETDADPRHRDALTEAEAIARLKPPKTIVVRFGRMGLVGEYEYSGDATPGCGSRLVCKTHRGTELATMLTTTCTNAGCGKSVTRQELLQFVERSGGRDYPFHERGQVLRVATMDDMKRQEEVEAEARDLLAPARRAVEEFDPPVRIVEVEPILGGERTIVYVMSEDRIDQRLLGEWLSSAIAGRIELRQVGARDEARLVADYERCGQYCCCKNFLKVLKPVSMGAAKLQKATLDPLKISGRCGRLMCCLRYEDQTYRELKERLPRRKTRVGTPEGPGLVMDTRVLVQLVLVRLESDGREIAVPVEELCDPDTAPVAPAPDPFRGLAPEELAERITPSETPPERRRKRRRRRKSGAGASEASATGGPAAPKAKPPAEEGKSRRRRRRRGSRDADAAAPGAAAPGGAERPGEKSGDAPKRRRRRRRRRGGGGGGGEGSAGGG